MYVLCGQPVAAHTPKLDDPIPNSPPSACAPTHVSTLHPLQGCDNMSVVVVVLAKYGFPQLIAKGQE